jgi:exodeoxyribonuclease VII small subunit
MKGQSMAEQTFEQALEELKSIVQMLEKGDRSLEESLGLFVKGIGLISFCSKKLDEVERKVEQLVTDQEGKLEIRPFEQKT